jgi:flavorubredoxin
MRNVCLFKSKNHSFILLNESRRGEGEGVRSNQYLIAHEEAGVILDPGGFGVMPSVLAEMATYIQPQKLDAIILSHQDPDIVGGLPAWLELTSAQVYVPRIWLRFLPHYGINQMDRFVGIPDEGMPCEIVPDFHVRMIPAHFLHSEGQVNVYDPISRILFTGDIGAAILPDELDYEFVDDFSKHLPFIEDFHRRYMCSNAAVRCWLDTIAELDIDMLAPQHGPVYRDHAVKDFLAWFRELRCGVDILSPGGVFAASGITP